MKHAITCYFSEITWSFGGARVAFSRLRAAAASSRRPSTTSSPPPVTRSQQRRYQCGKGAWRRRRSLHRMALLSGYTELGSAGRIERGNHTGRETRLRSEDGGTSPTIGLFLARRPPETFLQKVDTEDDVDAATGSQVEGLIQTMCCKCGVERYRHLDQRGAFPLQRVTSVP